SPTTGDCHPPSGSPRSRPCSAVSSPSPCPSRARVEEITRVTILHHFQDGEQVLLIDQRGKRYLLLLRKGETFHCDRGWIHHETIIGQPDGAWVRTSKGTRCLAIRPTLAEYVLDMPRGAQVIYPKDLAMVLFCADIFPCARFAECGLRSGGIFLSYLPTIVQSHQLSEALRRHPGYALVETFETLMRPWNIDGLSVRPFHRMVAHTGFITVARRVVPEEGVTVRPIESNQSY